MHNVYQTGVIWTKFAEEVVERHELVENKLITL